MLKRVSYVNICSQADQSRCKGEGEKFLGAPKIFGKPAAGQLFRENQKSKRASARKSAWRRKFWGFSSKIASFWAILSLSRGAETLFQGRRHRKGEGGRPFAPPSNPPMFVETNMNYVGETIHYLGQTLNEQKQRKYFSFFFFHFFFTSSEYEKQSSIKHDYLERQPKLME